MFKWWFGGNYDLADVRCMAALVVRVLLAVVCG